MTKISEIATVGTQVVADDLFEKETAAGESEQITAQMIKDFVLDGLVITPAPIGVCILVDDIYGDDSTGQPYSSILPFKTIQGAMGVMTAGDCIVVRPSPNKYADVNVCGDGVRFHYEHGADMESFGNCFNDFGSATFSVTGFGKFWSTSSVLFSSGNGNSVYIQGLYANGTGNGSRTIWALGSANVTIDIATDLVLDGLECTIRMDNDATMNIRCSRLIGKGGLIGTNTGADNGVINVYANEYIYDADGAGYVGLNIYKGTVNLYGGPVRFNGVGLYSLPAIWIHDSGKLIIHGDVISTNTDGLILISTTALTGVGNAEFKGDVEGVGIISLTGAKGTMRFRKNVTRRTTTGPVITQAAGSVIVEGFVINEIDDASASGIYKTAGKTYARSTAGFYCEGGTAKAVDSPDPQDFFVYGSPVSNVDVGADITQLVNAIYVDPLVIP